MGMLAISSSGRRFNCIYCSTAPQTPVSIKCIKNKTNDDHSAKQPTSEITNTDKAQKTEKLEAKNKPETKRIHKQILNDFTPQMVEALGGVDKVLEFPEIKNWDTSINLEHMKAPVMKGYHEKGRPFLLFCYFKYWPKFDNFSIVIEYLGRTKNGGWEQASTHHQSELNLRSPNPILDNTLAAQHMLDKITRLMKREAIGTLEQFPGIVLTKPSNKQNWRPSNAYLDGEELEQFMDLDTLFYERKPKKNSSELFLFDPRISQEENEKLFSQKFPDD